MANLQNVSISKLKPYDNNPRINDAAVDGVAASIKEFGFKVPIVVDKDYVIVTGHTRHKAAMKLGLKEVPCIIADDLSKEQIKAFRLADNKVSEFAEWDTSLLNIELLDITNVDMSDFGFELELLDYTMDQDNDEKTQDDDGYYGDERERTYNRYNLAAYDPNYVEGSYQMPILNPCDHIPEDIISFNYMLTEADKRKGMHFYRDDYQFERIWDRPEYYIGKISEFDCALTPDFSLYMDMPMAIKVWNVYRSRLIGQMMQRNGIKVIPTVSWAEKETFDFCFDGLPILSTLSVSTIGVKTDDHAFRIWKEGMDELIRVCKPKRLLIYGGPVDYNYGKIKTIYYNNQTIDRLANKEVEL